MLPVGIRGGFERFLTWSRIGSRIRSAIRVWEKQYIGKQPACDLHIGARDGPSRRRIRAGEAMIYGEPTSLRIPLSPIAENQNATAYVGWKGDRGRPYQRVSDGAPPFHRVGLRGRRIAVREFGNNGSLQAKSEAHRRGPLPFSRERENRKYPHLPARCIALQHWSTYAIIRRRPGLLSSGFYNVEAPQSPSAPGLLPGYLPGAEWRIGIPTKRAPRRRNGTPPKRAFRRRWGARHSPIRCLKAGFAAGSQ